MREIAEPCPAPFLLDGDAVQAERAKLRPQVARERIAAIDLVGPRSDLVLREIAHRIAQHVDVGAKAEIKTGPGIRDHAQLL